jgi:segregation and condensation protein A
MAAGDAFDGVEPERSVPPGSDFIVDIGGFEGPIDFLLTLARDQKVDLAQISILALAEQYLVFVADARRINLDLAADYLVMAAWLAYLKSRLLLPELGGEDEPSGQELADALAFQLRRLNSMQESGQKLMARSRLGQDFFPRGAPEGFASIVKPFISADIYDLLKSYGEQQRRSLDTTLLIQPPEAHSVEDAIQRLHSMLGGATNWESLWRFLPSELGTGIRSRSGFATTFAAGLELVKEGRAHLRQDATFGPIYLRVVTNFVSPADDDEAKQQ